MAQLLETLRNQIMTTFYGRRLGYDSADFLVGMKGERLAIEDFTTTAASSASPYGITRAGATGSTQVSQYTMQAIPIGATKMFTQVSTSTAGQQFQAPSGVTILTGSASSTANWLTLLGKGANASLTAVSSLLYQVVGSPGPLVIYSTST